METRRDVFQAIADPTRRQIISMLAEQPQNLSTVAGCFEMSRQAVTLHIKILEECGLVHMTQVGRERYCEARLKPLEEVAEWVEPYKAFWRGRFKSLDQYLQKQHKKK